MVISIFYLISCIFILFFNVYYIVAIVLLLFGILGIHKYNNPLCTYFLLYCLVRVGFNIYILYKSTNEINSFVYFILIFLELLIIHLLSRFMIKICYITNDELELLNENYVPTSRNIVLY